MAQATGPLFSLTAEGSIGDAITFQSWKGRNTIRRKPKPSNPRSLAQQQARAGITINTLYWQNLSQAEKETWQNLANASQITPYNALLSYNMKRKAESLAPKPTTAAGLPYSAAGFNEATITHTDNSITLILDFFDELQPEDSIGIGISETSYAEAQDPKNMIAAAIRPGGYTPTIQIENLSPGTYYISLLPFGTDGLTTDETNLATVTLP